MDVCKALPDGPLQTRESLTVVAADCSSHYPAWQAEFPSAAERFRPGGFGENLVVKNINERNICIGDTMSVGDEVILQVSLSRQPCFKLNHRFELKNFAPSTWKTSRTGWYYRVLKEGFIQAGDEIRLLERKHPQWNLERVQEYLHRNTNDMAMTEELAAIPEFGNEAHSAFVTRLAKQKAKDRKKQEDPAAQWRDFRCVEKTRQTPRITSFVLEAVRPLVDPDPLSEGAHARLRLGNGLVRSYSIVSGDRNRLELGIALDEKSRGGSRYLHESVNVGDAVQIGRLTEAKLVSSASSHVFVAAGIGLTAFLALLQGMRSINYEAKLHYAVRSAEEVAFRERLDELGDCAVIYDKSKGQRLSIRDIIGTLPWNSRLYFCGPSRLMEEAVRETTAAGIGAEDVHFEAFAADTGGDPFEAVVANRGEGEGTTVTVGGEETLLEALLKQFDDIPSSCEVGNCGTCKVALKSGRVEHRGTALSDVEKADSMLSCVSRGVGRIVVEL